MSDNPKKVDKGWQKKAGLDLHSAKPQIYKDELASARVEGRVVPKTSSAQVHANTLSSSKKGKAPTENELVSPPKKHDFVPKSNRAIVHANALKRFKMGKALNQEELTLRDWMKKKALKKLKKLGKMTWMVAILTQLREGEGYLYCVLELGGIFDNDEADFIADCAIRHHQRPGGHPLQTAVVHFPLPKFVRNKSISNTLLYSYPSLKQALARRGFFLNRGHFSPSETLTLMKNFEKFLSEHGRMTDPDAIADLIKNGFREFYRKHKMFLFVGENLNRTSTQLYERIKDIYHLEKRDRIPASEDALILERSKTLKELGIHRRFKVIGAEMGRYRKQITIRHQTLGKCLHRNSPEVVSIKEGIFQLVDNHRGSIDAIPYDSFATALGCERKTLEKYWVEEGKQRYIRSKLPRWTLEDTDLLLLKVAESGEDEEKCVDFKEIFEENFQGKCADWQHLRERFSEIRRDVPFYMLDDLQSVVAATRKDVNEKLLKKAANGGLEEEEEVEQEEAKEEDEEEEDD